jgi:hypothetical protein
MVNEIMDKIQIRTRIARMTRIGFVLLIGLLLWTSCTKARLYYQEQEMVRIYPDRSVYDLPALEYYFYATDGEETIRANSDNQGNFEGELTFGTYRVIATNTTTATNGSVAFTTDSYEQATVTVQPTEQTRALSTLNAQLSTIYSVVVEELPVRRGIQTYRPVPLLLTKQLELVFVLSGGLETEVKTIVGVLPGIYSSVYLATGLPTSEALTQSSTTAVRFDIAGQGDERETQVSLLGLRDPRYREVYVNNLDLTLAMNDDSEEAVTIDLSNELSDLLSLYQGVLPPESSVTIRLERNPVGGVDASIDGSISKWEVGGEVVVAY